MKKTGIFYGSTTGTTESVAGRIADVLGISSADVHDVSKLTAELVSGYEVLLLGTSTWETESCRMTGMMASRC